MGLILNIDTSTEICSVALARDGELIALREDTEGMNHSVLLGVFVDEILKEEELSVAELDAVAVSMGPGSYTGLRIGVSLAKGLCYGGVKPLIAVPTLQALALSVAATSKFEDSTLYCPMIDARRMEVYTALYDRNGDEVQTVHAKVIDNHSFEEELQKQKICFFGNGSSKITEVITNHNAIFLDGVVTSAKNMISLSEKYFVDNKFEDVAYFEPLYLKDFVATIPKNRLLDDSHKQ